MLVFDQVRKTFFDPKRGAIHAVNGISLTCTNEQVVAIVGANGAGKSTLLRMVATLLQPDTGRVVLDGRDIALDPQAMRQRLGYLSTTTRLYPRLTVQEQLTYAGGFFGLTGERLRERLAWASEAFELAPFFDQSVGGLSTGMAQRVNLARTFLHDPDLVVLDEPSTGLDVVAARQVVETVSQARRPGRLLLLATHVLHEVEQLADRLLVIDAGRLLYDGPPAELGTGDAFADAIQALIRPERVLKGTPA